MGGNNSGKPFSDKRWLIPFFASLMVSLTLFFVIIFGLFSHQFNGDSLSLDIISFTSLNDFDGYVVDLNVNMSLEEDLVFESEPPRIAYLITGTKGDSLRMRRTLQPIYHPRNQYIMHLDLKAPPRERIDLAMYVKNDPLFSEVENVRDIARANLVTYKGPPRQSRSRSFCNIHHRPNGETLLYPFSTDMKRCQNLLEKKSSILRSKERKAISDSDFGWSERVQREVREGMYCNSQGKTSSRSRSREKN